ncbi:HAAS signaling domain-containing protein [Cellulomonas sp. NPDC055163]
MSTSTGTHAADVAGYAAAVRRHLAGLSAEQVEDLTDGLEADLADAVADHDARGAGAGEHDLVARFGDPRAYAAELRTSAGLPEPGAPAGAVSQALARPARFAREQADRALAALRPQPWWGPFEELARSMLPLAWFARAWVLYQVLRGVLTGSELVWMPRSFGGWVALAALTVVSVQWGRGLWQPGGAGRWVRGAATVVAALAVLPVVGTVSADTERVHVVYETQTLPGATVPQDGVVVDGVPVSNLFVYDAQGNPLRDVQVYDDRGRAVRTTFDDGQSDWALPGVREPWSFVAVADVDGRQRWNVFPLRGAPSSEFEWDEDAGYVLVGESRTPPMPFAKAPSLVLPGDTPSTVTPSTPSTPSTPEPTTAGAGTGDGAGQAGAGTAGVDPTAAAEPSSQP